MADTSPEALLESAARVVHGSTLVRVDEAAIRAFAAQIPLSALRLPPWDDEGFDPGSSDERVVAWLLAYNAVNFCYWPDEGPRWWTVVEGRPRGQDDEALGVMAAFAEDLRGSRRLLDASGLARFDEADLSELLAPAPGAGALPLMGERVAGLRALGAGLAELGGVLGLVEAAGGSAVRLSGLLAVRCGFEDCADHEGERLFFRKRAYLCAAMLHGRFQGSGPGAFSDIVRLPVFADYRLPQILRAEGALALEPALAAAIDRGEPLPAGCAAEVEIRAATVLAAERLRLALAERAPEVTALVVDQILWRAAVARQDALPPFHRTRTTAY